MLELHEPVALTIQHCSPFRDELPLLTYTCQLGYKWGPFGGGGDAQQIVLWFIDMSTRHKGIRIFLF